MSTARLIDGKAIAALVQGEVAREASAIAGRLGRMPGIAVVRVGEDPASKVYVSSKERMAQALGFASWHLHLDAAVSQGELLATVDRLNGDPLVDGILVQLPLPRHLDAEAVLGAVDPQKDVDGFHVVNAGRLFQGRPGLVPCTPAGVMRLLAEVGYEPSGRRCVVVGRSNIVGRPMALLLLNASATVTVCHSKSDVAAEVARADLVVAAVGVPGLVRGEWIKPGAVVIDVGINRGADGKLTGDVDFEGAKAKASWISPVPGGVGPMTIAMLMKNTLRAAVARAEGQGVSA